jgi:hypothetical protein
VPTRLEERQVGAVSQDAAVQLVRAIASDPDAADRKAAGGGLTVQEAAAAAAACGCVPLLLRLVADALKGGRMTLEVRWRACGSAVKPWRANQSHEMISDVPGAVP